MTDSLKKTILPILLVVAGFVGVVFTSDFVRDTRPQLPESYADDDLSMNGSRLKGFALGMEGLLADWYWVRALQYMGDKMLKNKDKGVSYLDLRPLNPHLLYPLLNNATDLDPHFTGAYLYGTIVLPAIDKDQAVALAQKGIANNPNEWMLYQYLGYTYWRFSQYDKAAEAYEKGSEVPGASPFMKLMAASMRSDGGSRSTGRAIYRQMLSESDEEAVRITAERSLRQLDWLDERDAINAVLTEIRERTGVCPGGFGEILPRLAQITLPEGGGLRVDAARRLVDPTNVPYLLNREKCVVAFDRERTGLSLSE